MYVSTLYVSLTKITLSASLIFYNRMLLCLEPRSWYNHAEFYQGAQKSNTLPEKGWPCHLCRVVASPICVAGLCTHAELLKYTNKPPFPHEKKGGIFEIVR